MKILNFKFKNKNDNIARSGKIHFSNSLTILNNLGTAIK